jgi:hypothetical protein
MTTTVVPQDDVTVTVIQSEQTANWFLQAERRYELRGYRAPDTHAGVDGARFWRHLEDVPPPTGFEWLAGSRWSDPETFVYSGAIREAPVQRTARINAVTIEAEERGQRTADGEADDAVASWPPSDEGPFATLLTPQGPDTVKTLLGPQAGPAKDKTQLIVQRLLQLAWIASAASYQNPHTTTSVTKANKETPGTPILRPDQDGTLRRGVVTKRFNSQQVCVDYERLPVLMRELQPMPLTELESCIGSYSNYVRIAHVAYSAHNTINPETTRQHHLLFQLDPRQIFAPDVPLSDAAKPSPNDSSLLVLTARGSRNPMQDRSDWVTNLSLGTKAVATHEGFSARADSVPLLPLLDHLRRGGSIMFTGHSLGSAVAELVCQRVVDACRAPGAAPSIASALDEGRVVFIGFASPAIGTCAFNELKRSDAKYFFHIVNEADVVPHITNLSVVYPQLWAHAVTARCRSPSRSSRPPRRHGRSFSWTCARMR